MKTAVIKYSQGKSENIKEIYKEIFLFIYFFLFFFLKEKKSRMPYRALVVSYGKLWRSHDN